MSTPAVQNSGIPAPNPASNAPEFHVLMLDTENVYGVKKGSFVFSSVLNGLTIAALIFASHWSFTHQDQIRDTVVQLAMGDVPDMTFKVDKKQTGGGGGGGDRDKIEAPRGALPKTTRDLPLAPPLVVKRNPDPKLAVEAAVVAPPNLPFPAMANLGDPLSKVMGTLSNGTGSGGGIGSGSGGGVGSGRGPGVGPGWGGGYGGGVYRIGGGVTPPKALYQPDPEYSEEARKAKYQGVVTLSVVVGPDGRPHDMHVVRSLGMGLDEKALDAVRSWKFEPAKKDGQPVAVLVAIEVNFRLY